MALRIGRTGAVSKPQSSPSSIRSVARSAASAFIDLTKDDGLVAIAGSSGANPTLRKQANPVPRRTKVNTQWANLKCESTASRSLESKSRSQETTNAKSADLCHCTFVVTSVHHRPWDIGGDHTTIGVFLNKKEAIAAGFKHYQERCLQQADGWGHEWVGRMEDDLLRLRARVEKGEKDTETFEMAIEKKPLERQRVVQPVEVSARSAVTIRQQEQEDEARTCVDLLKEEQRVNVGTDLSSMNGYLNEYKLHRSYRSLEDANFCARELYDGLLIRVGDNARPVMEEEADDFARFLVEDPYAKTSYSIIVEEMWIQ